MNNRLALNLLIFAMGSIAGAVATWRILDEKYRIEKNEELEELRNHYKEQEKKLKESLDSGSREKEIVKVVEAAISHNYNKPDISEYTSIIDKKKYVTYSNMNQADEEDEENTDEDDEPISYEEDQPEELNCDAPYIISPDDFGLYADYDTIYLSYYQDGYLTDENDELVEDIEGQIGWESLNEIGKYEPDIIHVRNDQLKSDYEICRVLMDYEEPKGDSPQEEQ